MSTLLLSIPRSLFYSFAAVAGFFTSILIVVMNLATRFVQMCSLGRSRSAFVAISRGRSRPLWMGVVALAVGIGAVLGTLDLSISLTATLSVFVLLHPLYNYHGRILHVSNHGKSKWAVHMNLLFAFDPARLWRGAFGELENLIAMAGPGRAASITFESPLLVNDRTATRLKLKLEKVLIKHGVDAVVQTSTPQAMSLWRTGLIGTYLWRQRNLKSERRSYERAPWNLHTRKIEIQISTTRSSSPARAPGLA